MLTYILLIPLLSAICAGFLKKYIGARGSKQITTCLMGYNLAIIIYLFYNVIYYEGNYGINFENGIDIELFSVDGVVIHAPLGLPFLSIKRQKRVPCKTRFSTRVPPVDTKPPGPESTEPFINWRKFSRFAIVSIVCNSFISGYFSLGIDTFIARQIIGFLILLIISSKYSEKLKHYISELDTYVAKKNKILTYDWLFMLILSAFFFALSSNIELGGFGETVFVICGILYLYIGALRIYYAFKKDNPWPKTGKAAAICYECTKYAVGAVGFTYAGSKILYGVNYRPYHINEIAGLFPGTVKSDNEIALSTFWQCDKVEGFVREEYLIEKKIGPFTSKRWINEPKLAEFALKKGMGKLVLKGGKLVSVPLDSSDE